LQDVADENGGRRNFPFVQWLYDVLDGHLRLGND